MNYDTWKTNQPYEPSEQESDDQFDDDLTAGEEKFEANKE